MCVVYACFAGAGVAHTHGETEDEERGGSAGSGTGLRPCSGGLRNTQTKCILLFNAAYVTFCCKYCKTEESSVLGEIYI